MADFKLRAPPRLRLSALVSIGGVIGQGAAVPLAGSALASAQAAAALLRGVNLGGAASASAQATAALLRGLRLQGAAVAGASSTASLGWSVAPVITFLAGTGGTFSVAATGPTGYTAGGVYGVDPLNTALPTLITLSDAGLLSDGGSAVTSANSIRFTYHEPGALPTLTLHPTVTATLPYHATIYPVEGAVPSGQILVSPDDVNLRGSVLSAWPDGSAQVMVVAGETAVTNGVTKAIRLRPGAPSGAALTAARIDAIVSDIVVNFGGGDQTLSDFTSPSRTWWANSATICCRYVLGCGLGTMKAIIDIHAFKAGVSNRAFVEVVIENGEVNANLATVTGPSTQTYTGATVKVNGATIATVSSPTASMAQPNSRRAGTYAGGHEPGRAWYCSTWVGLDPGLEVTHDAASMQAHPWFWKPAVATSENLATKYAQAYDTYVPWSVNRLRIPGMNGTGGDEEIAMHTMCQSDYFLFGDKVARRAVLASGLAMLSTAINYRHTDGTVPTKAQQKGKTNIESKWPSVSTEPRYGQGDGDASHIPCIALVPFLCRPSPCFIELAQKEFIWHQAGYRNQADLDAGDDGSHSYDQTRSRAWRARAYAVTIFLTPDSETTRKADYRAVLRAEIDRDRAFLNQAWNTFKYLYDPTVSDPSDASGSRTRSQGHWFMHHFVTQAFQHVAMVNVLRAADQTVMDAAADEVGVYPLRWFSDAQSYEWRAVPYQPTVGVRVGNTLDQSGGNLVNYTAEEMGNARPGAPGGWMTFGPGDFNWPTVGDTSAASVNLNEGTYPSWFFSAVCAMVERDVPGAASAWLKIYGTNGLDGGINNLLTWRTGMANTPTWNRWPRNK
jgi:hypothetical protein